MEWQQPLHTARQDGILVCSTWIHSSISTALTASHASTGPRHVYAATALRLSRGVVVCLLWPRPSGAKLNTVPSTPPWRPVPRFGMSTQACRLGGPARRGRCPGVQLVRPGWAQRLGSHVERCDVYVLWLHSSELLRQANTPHLPRRVTALRLDLYCTCTFVSASL